MGSEQGFYCMNLCVRVDYEVSSLEFPFLYKDERESEAKIAGMDLKFIVNDMYGKYNATINHKLPRKPSKLLILEAH